MIKLLSLLEKKKEKTWQELKIQQFVGYSKNERKLQMTNIAETYRQIVTSV